MLMLFLYCLLSLCSASYMNITCMNSCPETIPFHTSVPITCIFIFVTLVMYSPGTDAINQTTVSITSSDNTVVYFSDGIEWALIPTDSPWNIGNFTLYYKFIFSPEAQNVPLERTIPVNIIVAWTEVEERSGRINGATSQSLEIIVTDLKPNFMIGTSNSAIHVSNWIFNFMLLHIL